MKFLTNLDLSQNEIQNAVIQPLAAAPANPKLGQIDNMKRKIRKYRGLLDSGRMTLESVLQSYASWCGHISHGNTYHLRQNMDAYFFGYFPELRPTPKGENTHGPKTEQPRKQVEGEVRHHSRQADHLARG